MKRVEKIINKSKKESTVDDFTAVLSESVNELIKEVIDEAEFMFTKTRDNKRILDIQHKMNQLINSLPKPPLIERIFGVE